MSNIRRTYKYRIYPTRRQAERLEKTLSLCCELYNAALQERVGAWKNSGASIGFYEQSSQLPEINLIRPEYKEVYSQVLQDVLHRIDKTFRAFFRRCKTGQSPGFPRFRSRLRYDSFSYPQLGFGIKDGRLALSKIGRIKIKLHRPLVGKVKTCTIKREAGRWYSCFSCEVESSPLPESNKSVGVDLGLQSFIVLSDGTEIDKPRHYREAQAKLRRAQRKVSRRRRGSCRRRKAVRELQRVHAHIRNQRSDFHHKVAFWLVAVYGIIAIEDLNVKGMARSFLARSVNDAGWSAFISKLCAKAECAGRTVVKVNPSGTSQTCLCGQRVEKKLSDRWHHCPACGLSAGRDHVSAQVILQRALGRSVQDSQPDALIPGVLRSPWL